MSVDRIDRIDRIEFRSLGPGSLIFHKASPAALVLSGQARGHRNGFVDTSA